MNPPGIDPITKLFKALSTSERMKGIRVTFGARSRPLEDSTPSIVMIPDGGPLQPPDHNGNQADAAIAVDFECWGRDFSQLWEVCRRLVDALNDYHFEHDDPADETADGVSDWVSVDYSEISFGEPNPDTNRQGWFAVVTATCTAAFESTPLSEHSGIGHVDDVIYVDVTP